MAQSDNMDLWNQVCETNPADTKSARLSGRNVTAIDPQKQRKRATELFGPFGMGWGVEKIHYSYHDVGSGVTVLTYSATLWYNWRGKLCYLPIASQCKAAYTSSGGKFIVDDESLKKASTDALTKGLSALGFNSDVFEGKFDDNKYVAEMREKFGSAEPEPGGGAGAQEAEDGFI